MVKEKELLAWVAPARPFKRRNREFYVTIIAIAAILGMILFLVDGFLPVVLVVSLVFLFYVMNTVPPEEINYRITDQGIYVGRVRTDYSLMGRFWFSRRFDNEILVIETANIGGRLEMIINPDQKEEIKKVLEEYLAHEAIPASRIDQAANWFSRKLPQ